MSASLGMRSPATANTSWENFLLAGWSWPRHPVRFLKRTNNFKLLSAISHLFGSFDRTWVSRPARRLWPLRRVTQCSVCCTRGGCQPWTWGNEGPKVIIHLLFTWDVISVSTVVRINPRKCQKSTILKICYVIFIVICIFLCVFPAWLGKICTVHCACMRGSFDLTLI